MKNVFPRTGPDRQPPGGLEDRRATLIKLSGAMALLGGLGIAGEAFGTPQQAALLTKIFTEALSAGDVKIALAKFDGGKGLPPSSLRMLESLRPGDLKVLAQFRTSVLQLEPDLRAGILGAL